MARLRLALPLALAVLAATATGAAPARASAPISSHAMLHTCCTPPPLMERLFSESKAMGARFIRVDVELSGIFREPGGGHPAWERLDQVMELSRRFGLPVLGILMSPPPWLSSCPEAGAGSARCPPRDVAEFGRLAGLVAAHARGTIAHWEVVNEPDASWAFLGSAEQYAHMLRATHDAIAASAPEARVVIGGVMAPYDLSWIERVLATPGVDAARAFHVANVHLRGPASAIRRHLVGWRALLSRHGFAGPLWVTEHGYPADPAYQSDPAFRGGEPAQAAFLTESLLDLAAAGADEVFVTLRDNLDGAFASEGVVDVTDRAGYPVRRKPAFAALRRLVERWDELAATRAEQRLEEEALRLDQARLAWAERALAYRRGLLRTARAALAAVRAKRTAALPPKRGAARRARRTPTRHAAGRGRLKSQLAEAKKRVRRRTTEVGWAKAIADSYRLRTAMHAQRVLELAVKVASG